MTNINPITRLRNVRKVEEAFSLADIMVSVIIMAILTTCALVLLPSAAPSPSKAKSAVKPEISTTPVAPASHVAPIEFPWAVVLGFVVGIILVIALVALIMWFVRKQKAVIISYKNNTAGWEKLITRHRELRMKWASYELDIAKLIDFPLMTDMREPVIVDLHMALRKAANLEPSSARKMSSLSFIKSDFWTAVNNLDVAFSAAENAAKRVAWSKFTPSERRGLSTAKQMLSLAMDTGASPAERQAAYRRVLKELQGLIEFPEKARLEIEARHQLAIAS